MMILDIAKIASRVLERVLPDENQRTAVAHELDTQILSALQASDTAQAQVNLADAQSGDAYQRRWRPTIGWVCALAFGWHYLLQPLLTWALLVSGHRLPDLPTMDMAELSVVLMGMLGLGVYRTAEKIRGKA